MTKRKDLGIQRCCEARTMRGEVVHFSASPENVEKIKEALGLVGSIDLPKTMETNVSHGGYGLYSRYQIKQHEYGGSRGGFIEAIEIVNAPDDRNPFVIFAHFAMNPGKSYFIEFSNLKSMKRAHKSFFGEPEPEELASKKNGFIRFVKCGALLPWFYAVGNQALVGDYVYPDYLQNDPVYKYGKLFLVPQGYYEAEKLKTCMGCLEWCPDEYTRPFGGEKREKTFKRLIFWDDGTFWNENPHSPEGGPRPLLDEDLWVSEALYKFRDFLAGGNDKFEVSLINGDKFIGRLSQNRSKEHQKAGEYYCKITFSSGESVEGGTGDFVPTKKTPDVITMLQSHFKEKGLTIKKVEIERIKTEPGGKKWSGVFHG